MIGTDTGVVCPGREGTKEGAEHHAGEGEHGGNERARPASAEVGEFGNGLGKQDLIGVALEVAEDGSAKDGCNDNDAEKRCTEVIEGVGKRRIEEDLATAVADRAKAFGRDGEERKREPD